MQCISTILRWRQNECKRFETGGGNFLLENQSLLSHSIQLGLFLWLECQIIGYELGFGSHDGDESKKYLLSFNTYNTTLGSQYIWGTIVFIKI